MSDCQLIKQDKDTRIWKYQNFMYSRTTSNIYYKNLIKTRKGFDGCYLQGMRKWQRSTVGLNEISDFRTEIMIHGQSKRIRNLYSRCRNLTHACRLLACCSRNKYCLVYKILVQGTIYYLWSRVHVVYGDHTIFKVKTPGQHAIFCISFKVNIT